MAECYAKNTPTGRIDQLRWDIEIWFNRKVEGRFYLTVGTVQNNADIHFRSQITAMLTFCSINSYKIYRMV